MKNIKDKIYNALCAVIENVSDTYPPDWEDFPAVQLTEENNAVCESTNTTIEEKAKVRYRIDIWHNKPTSETALIVDQAVSALGLARTACMDAPEPNLRLKHKVMRYEGIICMDSDAVYWP